MTYSRHYIWGKNKKSHRYQGTAIIETAVGLCVLVPILLLLFDVISLLLGQTINDDLAKSAARAASQCSTQSDGLSAATNYIIGTQYTGSTGLVANAILVESQFNWDSINGIVTVVTQVTVNLPIPVPLGGPSSQVMKAEASEPILGLPPVPSGGAAVGAAS